MIYAYLSWGSLCPDLATVPPCEDDSRDVGVNLFSRDPNRSISNRWFGYKHLIFLSRRFRDIFGKEMKQAYLILQDVERASLVKTGKCCHFPPQSMAFSTVSLPFPMFARNRKTFLLSFSLHGLRRKLEEWRGAAETVQRSTSHARPPSTSFVAQLPSEWYL
jgi:hypothetical protein